jgi:AAA15 family ATPase/GTPase
VDEMENGIFHQKLPLAWRAIHQICETYNVQLFASTHSKECLKALLPLIDEKPDDFRLLRAQSKSGGGHNIIKFEGKDFRAALKAGDDPRQADLAV